MLYALSAYHNVKYLSNCDEMGRKITAATDYNGMTKLSHFPAIFSHDATLAVFSNGLAAKQSLLGANRKPLAVKTT
jgi:hypothetical protein